LGHHKTWGWLLIFVAIALCGVFLRPEAAKFWDEHAFVTNVASSVVTGMFGLGFVILVGGPVLRSVDGQRDRARLGRELTDELAVLTSAARKLFSRADDMEPTQWRDADLLLTPLLTDRRASTAEPIPDDPLTWQELLDNQDLIEQDARIAAEVIRRAGPEPGAWFPPGAKHPRDLLAEMEEAWAAVKERRLALRRAGFPIPPRYAVEALDRCFSGTAVSTGLPSYLRGTLVAGQLLEHARAGAAGPFMVGDQTYTSLEDLGETGRSVARVVRTGCLHQFGIYRALHSLTDLAKTAVWMAWLHGSRHAPEMKTSPADDS
jgi:hypothetical protein